jgi:hypothetical protein
VISGTYARKINKHFTEQQVTINEALKKDESDDVNAQKLRACSILSCGQILKQIFKLCLAF